MKRFDVRVTYDLAYMDERLDGEWISQKEALLWAVGRWRAEVENRPLVNVYRRILDTTWRQVIRALGGDPDELVGPTEEAAKAAAQADFETRIRSALQSSPPVKEAVVDGARRILADMASMRWGCSGRSMEYVNDWFNERARESLAALASQNAVKGEADAAKFDRAVADGKLKIIARKIVMEHGGYEEDTIGFLDLVEAIYTALKAASQCSTGEGETLRYATRLLLAIAEKHYPEWTPNPLPDLIGVLTQIDNLTSGLVRVDKGEAVAWLHQIAEPDGQTSEVFSRSHDNPWSHWIKAYRDKCEYVRSPLYARPAAADAGIEEESAVKAVWDQRVRWAAERGISIPSWEKGAKRWRILMASRRRFALCWRSEKRPLTRA